MISGAILIACAVSIPLSRGRLRPEIRPVFYGIAALFFVGGVIFIIADLI
jgi:hypothetical protein